MTTLAKIVIAHHRQAAIEARRTLQASNRPGRFNGVPLMRKFGNRYTTRVEKRLQDLDVKARR